MGRSIDAYCPECDRKVTLTVNKWTTCYRCKTKFRIQVWENAQEGNRTYEYRDVASQIYLPPAGSPESGSGAIKKTLVVILIMLIMFCAIAYIFSSGM